VVSPSLFSIADEIEEILAREVDPETGELTEAAIERLEGLELARDRKALEVAAYLKGERAEAEKIEQVARELLERAQIHQRRADRLERYVATCVPPGEKLADARAEIRWNRSQMVNVVDESQVPAAFWVQPAPPPARIDKRKVAEELKKPGGVVPGAELMPTYSLKIR
jgi:transcriptional regulator